MRHHTGLARALTRKHREAFFRALLHINKILFVREAVVVRMVGKVNLVNDTSDIRVIGMSAYDFFRIPSFNEERGIDNRYVQMFVNYFSGLFRAGIRARDDAGNREGGKVAAHLLRLAAAFFREFAIFSLANALSVQKRLAVADEIKSPWAHTEHDTDNENANGNDRGGEDDERLKQHSVLSITERAIL